MAKTEAKQFECVNILVSVPIGAHSRSELEHDMVRHLDHAVAQARVGRRWDVQVQPSTIVVQGRGGFKVIDIEPIP